LEPCGAHVDRLAIDDRRDRIEEGELAFAGQRSGRFGQRRGGEGAGCDDDRIPFLRRQAGDLAALDGDERMRFERRRDRARKTVAIDCERPAGRHLVGVALAHDQRPQPSHLLMQQANRVRVGVVRAERI
jgi:hypothetical protein